MMIDHADGLGAIPLADLPPETQAIARLAYRKGRADLYARNLEKERDGLAARVSSLQASLAMATRWEAAARAYVRALEDVRDAAPDEKAAKQARVATTLADLVDLDEIPF